jgi:hypothetical protein
MINDNQIINYFLPSLKNYSLVEEEQQADICLFSIMLKDKSRLRNNEINVLISVESMILEPYLHHLKYGDFGNPLVDIYIYNHHSEFKKFDNKILIPTIQMRINYYLTFKNSYQIQKPIPFNGVSRNLYSTFKELLTIRELQPT